MDNYYIELLCGLVIIVCIYVTGFYFGRKDGKKVGFAAGWNSATEYYDGDIWLSLELEDESNES